MPTRHNQTLQAVIERVNADRGLHALWRCANVNAVDRLAMSDHGPVHVRIVANIALRILRGLVGSGQTPSIVVNHGMTVHDAEVVTVLAALLHDIGMAIHRDDHERYSLFLAEPKARSLLAGSYVEPYLTVMVSEILHAIIAHRAGGRPLTIEAGVVRVADALDMSKGRSRIPFEAGQVNIHSVSAAAIDSVVIAQGEDKPIRIDILMSNSAGIFQLDELLKEKLRGSGIEQFVEVTARIEGETERSLLHQFRL
ncbi:MAG: HD domain-containing protein [Chloroflexota bacterium]|nr:MAG: HD domain-containing protein [Chloroflexota bacterium]